MLSKRFISFHDNHPLIGPIFWMLNVQYFITQYEVARAWSHPFSLEHNTISDLGNTMCGIYNTRTVCSPDYIWMNSSFVLLGLAMIIGAGFIYPEFRDRQTNRFGFIGLAIAGFGTILVGVFPRKHDWDIAFSRSLDAISNR